MNFLKGLALGLLGGGFIVTYFGFMALALSGAGVGLLVIFIEEWRKVKEEEKA
jgi:hypothetical protein